MTRSLHRITCEDQNKRVFLFHQDKRVLLVHKTTVLLAFVIDAGM